ncbi:hypothetical protein BamMEX5DRAFT_2634 [Burkholderia ambifaria MEX-5]|uniref:Uncharacterized protein n=1 Tax=Burkholderia ambifaria MEX-5 TaxID=396597 RepID=B1T4B8_9BURK|nr:hypothetical protein BamMEX5DRAFT_2634 [Burkholderia ambifaria MEX-5]
MLTTFHRVWDGPHLVALVARMEAFLLETAVGPA